MQLNLVVDSMVQGKIYPALAKFQAKPYTPEWRQFSHHWPHTVPLRLQEYFESHGPGINIFTFEDPVPDSAYYAIGLSWFDFAIDYFGLIPRVISDQVKTGVLKVLFFYHEGDNPSRIKQRLDALVCQHRLPPNCYVFVSSNSAADHLPQFVSFQDSELWYWHRNQDVPAVSIHSGPRSREFTALNRLHKWWRAAIMADLQHWGILQNSYWSYCESITDHDSLDDCPIEIDAIPDLRHRMSEFLKHAPYVADELTQEQRNDHSQTVAKFFADSYCNISIETMFDYDQSGGVLISEKTFKPIKHGQMFFVAGAAGSLQCLRDLGYRVFDSVLDNDYDLEQNHTHRWIKLRNAIKLAQQQGVAKLFQQALPDIAHNQQLFVSGKHARVSKLLAQIHDKSR